MSQPSERCAINDDAADEKSAPPPTTSPRKETINTQADEKDVASRQPTTDSILKT